MSYCRFVEGSNIYMYPTSIGGIECCDCKFGAIDEPWPFFNSRLDAHDHLLKHRDAGHQVPQYALDQLVAEIAEFGDEV